MSLLPGIITSFQNIAVAGPYVVGYATDYHANSSETWEFTLPEHEAGDILFMFIHSLSPVIDSWSASTGWTYHGISPTGTDMGPEVKAMQWIRSSDGATANPTINAIHSSNTNEVSAICYVIRGAVASGNPRDARGSTSSYSTDCIAPAVTPTVDGGLLLAHVFKWFPTSDTISVAPPPTGWSIVGQSVGSAGPWKCYGFAWDTLTTNGVATPSDTLYTFTGPVGKNCEAVILKPAPATDSDYAAYYARVLANSSDLSSTEKTAMETFIVALKWADLWDDITYLHVHVGNDYNAAKTYVKGGYDLVSAGSTNFLASGFYSREVGFHRNNTYSYETKGTFGNGATFDWYETTPRPVTRTLWGRNNGTVDPIGLHTHNNNGNYTLYFYGSAYNYGMRTLARNSTPSTQEVCVLGGNGINTFQVGAVSYDGRTDFVMRNKVSSGSTGGTTGSLSSDHEDTSGPWQIHLSNPVLGFCVCDGTEWSAAQMDDFNALVYNLHGDLGLTYSAIAPW